MGAWGQGNFENDNALDYLNDVLDQDELSYLHAAFDAALQGDIDSPEACEALAAVEVLCAACGAPADDASEELLEWVEGKSDVPEELIAEGLRAIAAVKTESELRELWEETDDFEDWLGVVEDAESRLADFA